MSLEASRFPLMRLGRVAETQLGKMLQPQPAGPSDVRVAYLRAGLLGPDIDPTGLPTMWADPREIPTYCVQPGDLLVSEGGDVGRTAFVPDLGFPVVIQNSAHRVRTVGDRRFLRYALDALAFAGWLDVVVNRSTFGHLTTEKLRALRIPWPAVNEQAAIADYLDTETARIDALVEAKRRQIALLDEHHAGRIALAIRELTEAWGEIPLKFVVDHVSVGIVVTPSIWYAAEGVSAIRGLDVEAGAINTTDLLRITPEGDEFHRKSRLNAGDVVVVRTGQAGAAAVVPPSLDGANCIDLIVIRPGHHVDSKFLEFVLNSDWSQKQIDQHSVGTIQAHFNVGAMRELRLPRAPLQHQRTLTARLMSWTTHVDTLSTALTRQVALLQERKQALITAAVTGQLDIPGTAA